MRRILESERIAENFVDYIDPMIGASTEKEVDLHSGKTFPGACMPYGLVQLSPDTVTGGDCGSGYSYHHDTLEGFSFTHMSGIGAGGDLGNLLVTPTIGLLKTACGRSHHPEEGYRSRFSHTTEVAKTGYYSIRLDDYDIRAEMTAANRAGILRFTFPKTDEGRIQIDLARRVGGTSTRQRVEVIDNQTIRGWMRCEPEGGGWRDGRDDTLKYTAFFYARFSKPFKSHGVWSADIPDNQPRKRDYIATLDYRNLVEAARIVPDVKEYEGKHIGFFANYSMDEGEVLLVKAGISFVDMEGAQMNLEADLDDWDFERIRSQARNAWDEALSRIRIQGASDKQKIVFATAMYHAQIDPRQFSDTDGRYYGGDKRIHRSQGYSCRTIFSGWDVFRSEMPLLTIIDPRTVSDTINSLIEMSDLSGMGLPRWELMGCHTDCMCGDPAIVVIVDAYMKGIRDFDVEKAYALCRQTSLGPHTTRGSWEEYNSLGYVPENISETLENCYADWCVAQFAKALGKKEDYRLFSERAQNYRNIYDPSVGLMRRKDSQGQWMQWEGKTKFRQGCRESNPFQQSWFVPHDVPGLIELMGEDLFLSQLTELFDKTPEGFHWNDYYNHPNEPVHHVPYLFNYVGAPWLTQKWARKIMDNAYGTGVRGLCGNEDVGQMSAWYILSAMGFHPVCPGSNKYLIGSPLYKEAIIHLDPKYYTGDAFVVKARNNSEKNVYVSNVKLNGQPLDRVWITHREIVAGGTMEFIMASKPDKSWKSKAQAGIIER